MTSLNSWGVFISGVDSVILKVTSRCLPLVKYKPVNYFDDIMHKWPLRRVMYRGWWRNVSRPRYMEYPVDVEYTIQIGPRTVNLSIWYTIDHDRCCLSICHGDIFPAWYAIICSTTSHAWLSAMNSGIRGRKWVLILYRRIFFLHGSPGFAPAHIQGHS